MFNAAKAFNCQFNSAKRAHVVFIILSLTKETQWHETNADSANTIYSDADCYHTLLLLSLLKWYANKARVQNSQNFHTSFAKFRRSFTKIH